MSNAFPSACISIILLTQVCASESRHASHSTSSPNGGFDFPETALKRRDWPYLQLPLFQHSRVPLVEKERFSPARGSGREQLSDDVIKVLRPAAARHASRRGGRWRGINVACYLKKMIVKVNKHVLGPERLAGALKLGTCDVSKSTKKYHVFMYDMDQCGGRRKLINNRVTYSNTLHYYPVMSRGPIRRAVPFSTEIECHFNRYHYSYKIGFSPQVEYQNFFRPLKTVDNVVLTARDAMWRRLPPTEAYTIGNPMYFQADGPPLSEGERLFVDSCYVTSGTSHLSMPRYTVIENHGCMTDSKSSRWSKFIQSGEWNIVQFSLDAFLFRGMMGKNLYMHCEISIGSMSPTPSSKSCTYNKSKKRWEELFGLNAVCSCCESKCLASDMHVTRKVITSDVWTMESELKILEDVKSTRVSPREMGADVIQVEATLAPDPAPHYYVTGLAVMEQRDELVEPRRIFEEVFGLD